MQLRKIGEEKKFAVPGCDVAVHIKPMSVALYQAVLTDVAASLGIAIAECVTHIEGLEDFDGKPVKDGKGLAAILSKISGKEENILIKDIFGEIMKRSQIGEDDGKNSNS